MILGPQGPGKVGQRGGFSYTRTAAHGQRHAGVAQLVEHYLAKVDVASSNLVSRSNSGLILSDGAFSFGIVRPRVSRIAGRLCHKVAAVLRGLNSSVTAATLRGV